MVWYPVGVPKTESTTFVVAKNCPVDFLLGAKEWQKAFKKAQWVNGPPAGLSSQLQQFTNGMGPKDSRSPHPQLQQAMPSDVLDSNADTAPPGLEGPTARAMGEPLPLRANSSPCILFFAGLWIVFEALYCLLRRILSMFDIVHSAIQQSFLVVCAAALLYDFRVELYSLMVQHSFLRHVW